MEESAPARPSDPNLEHPAVKVYRELCKLTPDAVQRGAMVEDVRDTGQWEEVIRRWLLAGYRKTNLAGMLDWYRNGIPERSDRHGGSGRLGFQGDRASDAQGAGRPQSAGELARRDAEWAALVSASRARKASGDE